MRGEVTLPLPDVPEIPPERILMIYGDTAPSDPIDQADIVEGCPLIFVASTTWTTSISRSKSRAHPGVGSDPDM